MLAVSPLSSSGTFRVSRQGTPNAPVTAIGLEIKKLLISVLLNATEILTTKCMTPNGNFLGNLTVGEIAGTISNISCF